MKTQRSIPLTLTLIALTTGAIVFFSCKKNSSSTIGTSHLEIRLTDAPAPYDAVYIDVQKVEINVSADTGTNSGWQTIAMPRPGVYNLLDFRNGIDTVLAGSDIPAGNLSQMRLTLGNNNSVVIGGKSYALKTPSGQQSGLKFNIHANITGGIVYRLWIDFDASRSIVTTGSGNYILKPVIRTYTDAIGGSLKGYVLPPSSKPQVWAVQGSDSLLAIPDSVTGYYFFGGVNAGSWNLSLNAQDTTYADTTFAVTISTGVVTNAGMVTLHKK